MEHDHGGSTEGEMIQPGRKGMFLAFLRLMASY
jgi:hypothetical protein